MLAQQPKGQAAAPPDAAAPARPYVSAVEVHFGGEWTKVAPPFELQRKLVDLVEVRRGKRLSAREVRRSIERLYESGELADVVARQEPLADGVRIIFELTPVRRVRRISVEGNLVFKDDEVVAAAGLGVGKQIFPERLEQAVAKATEHYRRRGYDEAHLTAELNELAEGVEVELTVEEGAPTRIAGIAIAGSPGLPLPRVLEAMALQLGDLLDLDALDAKLEQLRALYRAERFYGAVVSTPVIARNDKGAFLSIPVSAGPRYAFHFRGNQSMPDSLLTSALGYDGTEPLDGALIARLARRLETLYRYRGFHDARVRWREVSRPDRGQAILVFDIQEGRPLAVREVSFEGSHAVPAAELRQILLDALAALEPQVAVSIPLTDDPLDLEGRKGHEPKVAPKPELSTVLVDEVYRQAAEAMTALYRERGYLQAHVTVAAIALDVEAGRANVTFKVEEGVQAKVGEVRYAKVVTSPERFGCGVGNEETSREGLGLEAASRLRAGDPLSYPVVEQERSELLRALASEGYLYARVESEVSVKPDGAAVCFDVARGRRVRVGKLRIRGRVRSSEWLIESRLNLKEGEVLSPELLFESQRRLATMEVFRQATVQPDKADEVKAAPDEPEEAKKAREPVDETRDVVVDVREQASHFGDVSMGYSTSDGVRGGVQAVAPNIRGSGINLAARAKANIYLASTRRLTPGQEPGFLDNFGWQLNLSLSERLARVGLRSDVIFENVARPSYRFTRGAWVHGLDWPLLTSALQLLRRNFKVELAASPQFEVELDDVARVKRVGTDVRVDAIDQQRLRFPEGLFLLASLRLPIIFEVKDDPLNPEAGVVFNFIPEFVVGNRNVDLIRLSGGVAVYVPLILQDMVLVVSGRGGTVLPLLNPQARSIGPKRFFLGGANTLRGFREDGLIPEDRRATIREDIKSCRELAQPAGCTAEAQQVVNGGGELLSEGGDVYLLARAELRVPVSGAWGVSTFFEAGNLWLDRTQVDPTKLRSIFGAGLRYVTPVGPAALDVGWNFLPDRVIGEPDINVNISIVGTF